LFSRRCWSLSSCREWYLLFFPSASISRQLLLRLPEKPPTSSSLSFAISSAPSILCAQTRGQKGPAPQPCVLDPPRPASVDRRRHSAPRKSSPRHRPRARQAAEAKTAYRLEARASKGASLPATPAQSSKTTRRADDGP